MEKNDPLWKLLGKSPQLEPDAWFVARTLARCRREATGSRWGFAWAGWGWLTASALAVVLVVNVSTSPVGAGQTAGLNKKTSAKVQEALDYVADRGGEMDLWSE